jgi:2-(1,2-epoxy-1,2-dihydrophenyl)acetyl-CoA isomerase
MTILTEDSGVVRTITLNRPELRNAIDIPLRLALADALEAADRDASVRAIVLTGAGPMFCSGGDISTMQRMSPTEALKRAQLAQRVIRAIWNTPKPVIAAVEGGAFGAGLALAAACDRVVAATDARFATTFLNVGLAGDMGAYASLPARIGVAHTRQMLLMAKPIGAETALARGLVDDLADPGRCLESASADAHTLAARPAQALGVIKRLLAETPRRSGDDVLDLEATQQATLFGTDDFAEGVAAFQERRTPRFTGRTDLPQGAPS